MNVLLAFVAGRWRWALTQRRNSTREAIGWVTPSSDQLDHAGRRIRTRSAVGIFSTHRQRGRRHLRHKCGGSTLSDEEPLVNCCALYAWLLDERLLVGESRATTLVSQMPPTSLAVSAEDAHGAPRADPSAIVIQLIAARRCAKL